MTCPVVFAIICIHFVHIGYSVVEGQIYNDYRTIYGYSAIDYVCSNSSYNLEECNFIFEYDNSICQTHDYDAYLTCVTGMNFSVL